MKAPFALAIVAAAMLAPALAHAQVKQPIYVECNAQASDEVGKGLCSSLRDAIAKSPRYALIREPGKREPGKELHSVIILSSAPIVGGSSASSVVFGFAFGDGPITFLGHQVITIALHKVDEQAAGLLVDFDILMPWQTSQRWPQ